MEEILFHGFSISPWTNSSLCTTAIYDILRRRWRRFSTADADGSDAVYRWIELCLTSMFIRLQRGLPVLVGRAPQGTRARRGLPPCQEKGQGGAIPAVSKIVVDSNGQNECLLTVR